MDEDIPGNLSTTMSASPIRNQNDDLSNTAIDDQESENLNTSAPLKNEKPTLTDEPPYFPEQW